MQNYIISIIVNTTKIEQWIVKTLKQIKDENIGLVDKIIVLNDRNIKVKRINFWEELIKYKFKNRYDASNIIDVKKSDFLNEYDIVSGNQLENSYKCDLLISQDCSIEDIRKYCKYSKGGVIFTSLDDELNNPNIALKSTSRINKIQRISLIKYHSEEFSLIEQIESQKAKIPFINKNIFLNFSEMLIFKNINKIKSSYDFQKYSLTLNSFNVFQSLYYNIVILANLLFNFFRIKQKDNWYIKIGYNLDLFSIDFKSMVDIIPPRHKFWADPFLIKYKGDVLLFLEEYSYLSKKGKIVCLKLNGNCKTPEIQLSNSTHFSFPYVFVFNDNLYMLPENSNSCELNLYVYDEYNNKWDIAINIFKNIDYADPVLFFHENVWYLFVSLANNNINKDSQLYLYYSENLLDNRWIKHSCSPISIGSRNSRMAGNIFKINNRIYRPSQNCSLYYGNNVHFMEIKKISKFEYEESESSIITKDANMLGLHTFNSIENIVVVDVYNK